MRPADRVVAFRRPDAGVQIHAVVVPKSHVESLMSPELVEPSLLVALVTAVQSVARRLGLDSAGFHVEAYAMDPEVTPHVHWHVFGPGREAARGEDARSKL